MSGYLQSMLRWDRGCRGCADSGDKDQNQTKKPACRMVYRGGGGVFNRRAAQLLAGGKPVCLFTAAAPAAGAGRFFAAAPPLVPSGFNPNFEGRQIS